MTHAPKVNPRPFINLSQTLQRMLLLWEKPLSVLLLAGIIYTLFAFAVGTPWRVSGNPYHNYLADAFLHGQLDLRVLPPNTLDLSLYQGKYYLYWGPMPALMFMPLVAIGGVNVSDVLFSLVIGTANCGLLAVLLRRAVDRKLIALSPALRGALVLFFTLGTAQTPLPAVGRNWEIASLVTIFFSLLAFLAALSFDDRRAFFWSGLALGCVLLSRVSAVFNGIFLAWYLVRRFRPRGARYLITASLLGLLPFALAGLGQAAYNYLRFGDVTNFGLIYQLSGPAFPENVQRYGFFNLHYVPVNLYYMYVVYPFSFKPFMVDGWGGSLFLLSPLFFAALYALWSERRRALTWVLLATIIIGMIPSLVNIAPGTFQFGPRYTLDFVVPLLLLTALGMRRWPAWLLALLIGISIVHYLIGSLMFAFALTQ
jgi:hypothetical protein